jgi:hypothetical protein
MILIVPTSCALAVANEDLDPAKTVGAFIDNQTIAVAAIDLARLEVEPTLKKIGELLPSAANQLAQLKLAIQPVQAALRGAGVEQIYFVFSFADGLGDIPFAVIPGKINSSIIAPLLSIAGDRWNVREIRGTVVVGSKTTLDRLAVLVPMARDGLAAALNAVSETTASIVWLPTNDHRRAIEEMLPNLPAEIGGGPSTILTHGARWAAFAMTTPPNLSLRVVVQSQDAQAAERLRDKVAEAFTFAAAMKEVQLWPKVGDAIKLLVPRVEGDRLVLSLDSQGPELDALLQSLSGPMESARSAAARSMAMNQVKQLGLAMHNYYDVYKSFPLPGTKDATGKPLLSWRVHILPFIEQTPLYQQFHLDEPWDSEHNKTLIAKMPDIFLARNSKLVASEGKSTYQLPIGPEALFGWDKSMSFRDVTDGTSNTIMIVEVDDAHAEIWTKPSGIEINKESPSQGLGGHFEGGFVTVFVDGAAHFIGLPIDAAKLRALFTPAGGEVVDFSF